MVDGHKSASVISVVPFDEKGFAVVTIFVGVGEKRSCSLSVSKKTNQDCNHCGNLISIKIFLTKSALTC